MKTLLLTINLLLYSIIPFQQQDSISNVASIKLPAGASRLNSEGAVTYSSNHFHYKKVTSNSKNAFLFGSVLVTFEDYSTAENPVDLQQIKENILGEVGEIAIAESEDQVEIVKLNDNNFLLHKYHLKDEYFCDFISEPYKMGGIKGTVQFKKSDYIKGHEIFNALVKNIKIKK